MVTTAPTESKLVESDMEPDNSAVASSPAVDQSVDDYRYDTFRAGLILNDARFSPDSLRFGQVLPDLTLVRSDGEEISLRHLADGRPMVLITGSLTCPLSISALPMFSELHRLYGETVAFAFIYTREAHPGENVNQPAVIAEKVEHARLMKEIHGVDWPVLVDDLEGTLHRALDTKQNSVHSLANRLPGRLEGSQHPAARAQTHARAPD